jgi:serine protease Do
MSSKFNKFGAGAAVVALAITGGYMAHAQTAPKAGAVNAHPAAALAPAVAVSAPASFADIVQRVAPAVVSIEIDGKVTPASDSGGPRIYRNGRPDAQGLNDLPPEFRRFFNVPGLGGGDEDENGDGNGGGDAPQMHGAGSGFFISGDGYIVTNNHVIENADKITVHTADKRVLTAHIIGHDKATDLAVIKVDAKNQPFVTFEDSAKPRVGDWVVAVGNPFGLGGTATAGIVSAFGRNSGSGYVDYMQIDAPINPGNSGGPTFDLYGRVVGINSAIYSQSGGSVGIGFDIPADVADSVTKQLIANGKIARGFIGATISDVTPQVAEGLGVEAKGALVSQVTRGGPSADAGLKSGDIVLKVNGHEVTGANDLTRQVALVQAGGLLKLDVKRDGHAMTVSVKSGARPDEDKLAQNDDGQRNR